MVRNLRWHACVCIGLLVVAVGACSVYAGCPRDCKQLLFFRVETGQCYHPSAPTAPGNAMYAVVVQRFPRVALSDTFDLTEVTNGCNQTCPDDPDPQEANPNMPMTVLIEAGLTRYKCTAGGT